MNISNLQEFYEFTDFLSQRKIEANIDVQSSEKIFNLYTKDQEEIIKAYDLLSDEFSKTNFIRYLQYILLWSLVNENLASKMSNYLDKSLVEPLFEQCVRNFKLDDFVEALNINPNDSIREKCVFVLNNYLFQKYDYQANYGVDGNVDLTVKPGEICLDIGAARGDTVYYFIKHLVHIRDISFFFRLDFESIVSRLYICVFRRLCFRKKSRIFHYAAQPCFVECHLIADCIAVRLFVKR